jgi:hypothetical protein
MIRTVKIVVSNLHRSALRSMLLDDPDDFEREYADALDDDPSIGFSALLTVATTVMVRRRFAPSYTLPEVIRYVARVRVRLADPMELGALVIEKTIRTFLEDASIGEQPPFGGSPEDMATALLFHLVDEAALDEDGVTALIEEAAQLIDARELDLDALPVPVPPELLERLNRP